MISFIFIVSTASLLAATDLAPIPDTPFIQEYHETFPIPGGGPASDVRAVAVDRRDHVWAATAGGLFQLQSGKWTRQEGVTDGPLYELFIDSAGSLWIGAWDGIYTVAGERGVKQAGVPGTITAIEETSSGLIALGPEGSWRREGGRWVLLENKWSRHIRDARVTNARELYIATGVGLYRQTEAALDHFYQEADLYSGDLRALAIGPNGNLWIGARGGIDVYANGALAKHYGAAEGLPNSDVKALIFDREGVLWAGTELGVARFDGTTWSLRHSKRWLLSDDVRGIAFDSAGTAWIATAAGVSAIKRQTMTLEEKARYFLDLCHKRHVRPPYIVEKCWLPDPADPSHWEPRDDDNDGTFTAQYLAMESFRYAVTKDPEARAHADRAYDALEFLEKVTGVPGFFARTVVPSTWKEMADANHTMTPQEYAERRVRDPRTKRVDERWRPSADGQWLWKGDTSSDEMVGQIFGIFWYYRLAADDAHKARVRAHVRRIVDYIIDNGYVIRDLDGKATRWGVWAPESVLSDPDWRVEGVNKTFEVLSFLKAAQEITGDEKYQREFDRLVRDHGYAEIARHPKSYGRSERTHIQDDLLAMSTPGLLMTPMDPALHAQLFDGATWAYRTVENDQNPFFNFIYAMAGGDNFHLQESVDFLRDQPLDLRHWTIDNSQREDLEWGRAPMLDPLQSDRMLPPSERGVMRWDKNPWAVISGDFSDPEGRSESSGVFWLLPYWMGRYANFIAAP